MGIELPLINGMEVARQLREIDSLATLVFITNMEQYEVNGYEVKAIDFVVKPIKFIHMGKIIFYMENMKYIEFQVI